MVDIDDGQLEEDNIDVVENDVAAGGESEPVGEAPAAAAPKGESSIIKFLRIILGAKKSDTPAPVAAPQQPTAPQQQAPVAAAPTAQAPAAAVAPQVPATPAAEPYSDALMTVVVRNRFYRDGFRNMMRIAIVEAVIIIALILTFVSYMYVTQPKDHYFATTADGRIMKLVPLNLPNMSTSALMSWVVQSSTEVMTFGYHDYQRRLQQSSRHFTRYGWETFTNALQRSRIVESVEALRQVVTAKPRSAPILVQEGVFNGKYRWVVDLPLEVSYKATTSGRTDNLMVRMVIDRVMSLENPNGVGIEQWIAVAK